MACRQGRHIFSSRHLKTRLKWRLSSQRGEVRPQLPPHRPLLALHRVALHEEGARLHGNGSGLVRPRRDAAPVSGGGGGDSERREEENGASLASHALNGTQGSAHTEEMSHSVVMDACREEQRMRGWLAPWIQLCTNLLSA